MIPKLLEIEPTNVCNLSCRHCSRSNPGYSRGPVNHMSINLLKRLVKNYDYPFPKVQFCGTCEPTLNPKLVEMMKFVSSKPYISHVELITNGTLLSKKLCTSLAESGLTLLKVSIDGPDEVSSRKIRHYKLQQILDNVKTFSKITSIPVGINCVVNVYNLEKLYTFPSILSSIGASSLELRLFEGGSRSLKKLAVYEKNVLDDLSFKIKKECKMYNIKFYFKRIEMANLEQCDLFHTAHINYKGQLSLCFKLPDFVISDKLTTHPFSFSWEGKKAESIRKKVLKGEFLQKCNCAKAINQ